MHRGDLVGAGGRVIRAVVVKRIWVADNSGGLAIFGYPSEGVVLARFDLLLLTSGWVMHGPAGHSSGNQIQCSRGGWAEDGGVAIVVHREVLRIVPHTGDGIAVVVTHGHAWHGVVTVGGFIDVGRHGLWELVHLAAVVRGLLIAVVVILIRGDSVVWPDAEGLDGVGVLLPHYAIVFEVVCFRGVLFSSELWGFFIAALQLLAVLV